MSSSLCPLLRRRNAIALALLCLLAVPGSARADISLPPGFAQLPLASGLHFPSTIAYRPDGVAYIAERAGTVRVLRADGTLAPGDAIDISDHVNNEGDHGLLGLAVDGQWSSGQRFLYAAYIYEGDPANPDAPKRARIARFAIGPTGATPGTETIGPEQVILGGTSPAGGQCPPPSPAGDCVPADSLSHSIGSLRSAPDGTLYAGFGDGAGYGGVDPTALRTYDEDSLAGKVVHIDRDGQGVPGHAFCPADANLSHVCTKLYAKGFRNPFQFHLIPSGGLALGDVGWNEREEWDLVTAGNDYGWPCYEAGQRTSGYRDLAACAPEYAKEGTASAAVAPAYETPHPDGNAILGGPVYTGTDYPSPYQGKAFVADAVDGWIRLLDPTAPSPLTPAPFATGWFGVALESAPNQDLITIDMFSDALERLVYTPGNRAPVPAAAASPPSGPAPLSVHFSAAGSTDPDGDDLSYSWDFGDGSPAAAGPEVDHVYASGANRTAVLTVTDARGASASRQLTVFVGNSAPQVFIDSPADGSHYREGDTVTLTGHATDAEDPSIPDGSLTWDVRLIHNTHQHLGAYGHGPAIDLMTLTDHDADSHYVVNFTATDSAGESVTRAITIWPKTIQLGLDSNPPGAVVSYSGNDFGAPATVTAASGHTTTVSAPASLVSGGQPFTFARWSDGGARLHDIVVPDADTTLTATYEPPSGDPPPAEPVPGGDGPLALPPAGDGGIGGFPLANAGPPRVAPRARGRVIYGTAVDADGIRSVRVALRRVRPAKGGPCHWWIGSQALFARAAGRCSKPRWMLATLTRGQDGSATWRLALARTPEAPYAVRVLARDARGADSTTWLTVPRAQPRR
jgi:glucose/arabinose dehydrogenase/PKD repeat protein